MKRYAALLADMESAGYLEEQDDGEWVRYADANAWWNEMKERPRLQDVAEIHDLKTRLASAMGLLSRSKQAFDAMRAHPDISSDIAARLDPAQPAAPTFRDGRCVHCGTRQPTNFADADGCTDCGKRAQPAAPGVTDYTRGFRDGHNTATNQPAAPAECKRTYPLDPVTAEDPCEDCGRDQRKHEIEVARLRAVAKLATDAGDEARAAVRDAGRLFERMARDDHRHPPDDHVAPETWEAVCEWQGRPVVTAAMEVKP